MKVGDKVRFLNTTGGGIVKSFRGKDIALVEDNDGFDIPILIRECVVIDAGNEMQVRQNVKPSPQEVFVAPRKEEVIEIIETKEGEQITACLAYLPIDIKNISTTNYECYLVNDSNYYLMYNYMSRGNAGWVSRANGTIEPNTKIFLDEFSKSELNELEKVCVQFVAYKKDKTFNLKNPCSVEIKIDTVKFYKLHSFRENDYFEDEAIIYNLMRKDLTEQSFNITPEAIAEAMMEKKQSDNRQPQPIKRSTEKPVLEIDLHINELLDTTAGMEPKDMLDYQLAKVREIMDANKINKGLKIVFIHGKGDGVLKNAVINELKMKYKNAYYQDASFREYGFGATMVTIK